MSDVSKTYSCLYDRALQTESLSLVEASIADIQYLLASGNLTAVDLVAKLLHRISTFDCRGLQLNAIPVLNPDVFAKASASDARRARGQLLSPLDGIPYTVMDSYKVQGMSVANGSLAFQNVVANEDAFMIQKLYEAGAVLIGKTNMPSMATGGTQRGVYGDCGSPWSQNNLYTERVSESSTGSAIATAATFGIFSMAHGTIASGQTQASSNAIVTYAPSRGAISTRGIWPLHPIYDVVVPHTKTVDDLLMLLDVITTKDHISEGDFWREQEFTRVEQTWKYKESILRDVITTGSLQGVTIAVLRMHTSGPQVISNLDANTHTDILTLYQQAVKDLERLGATIIEVPSLPLFQDFKDLAPASVNGAKLSKHEKEIRHSDIIVQAWERFLHENNDPNVSSLADVDLQDIDLRRYINASQDQYPASENHIKYEKLGYLLHEKNPLLNSHEIGVEVRILEDLRRTHFENWLDRNDCDLMVFPSICDAATVGADADGCRAEEVSQFVSLQNGSSILWHCGVPNVTLPIGNVRRTNMPIGLTFAGESGDDVRILGWAAIYEKTCRRNSPPKMTPPIMSDLVKMSASPNRFVDHPRSRCEDIPELVVEKCISQRRWRKEVLNIQLEGYLTINETECSSECNQQPIIEVFVDAAKIDMDKINIRRLSGTMAGSTVFDFDCFASAIRPTHVHESERPLSDFRTARDSTMIVVVARMGVRGRPTGFLKLL